MNRRFAAGLFAFALIGIAATTPARALTSEEKAVADIVNEAVSRATDNRSCKALAIVARRGDTRITHLEGDIGNGTPPKLDSVFAIGSITKTLTATVLVWSVQQGTVRLDDPLEKYAPPGIHVPSFNGQKVVLSQLADHTGGFPRRLRGEGNPLQPAQAWSWLNRQQSLSRAPGSEYQYSAVGFGFLSLALERANHASLQQLYDRVISQPLGMRDTTFVLNASQKARLAHGFRQSGESADYQPEWYPAFQGAGALYSTLADMALYLDFSMGRKAIPVSSLLPQVFRPRHAAKREHTVGLGWDMETIGNITFYVKHGSQPGYSSMIMFAPATKSGAVVLANQARCPTPRIAAGIVRNLSGVGRGGGRDDWSDEDEE